ncbi:MAG: mechanosensitive ion channel family protein [Acidimicrobiales bacterium]
MRDFLSEQDLSGFAGRSAKIALVLVLALVFLRLGTRLAGRTIRSLGSRSPLRESSPRSEQRAETLAGVATSMVRTVVWTVAILLVLDEFGLNLGPLLAGASIVGVALGFGAQSLVKDFFSGFFILVEDQYAVGDVITIAETTGAVEEINLRVTRIRAVDGTVWFVPNGEIRKVGNSAKEWARAIVDVLVPNKADLAVATAAIAEEAAALAADPTWAAAILEPPEVLGVESLGLDNLIVRVSTKTTPAHRVALARAMRSRISGRLRREGMIAETLRRPTSEL